MTRKVFLTANRNGYAPDQCGGTMTVGELIRFLEGFDEESEIYVESDKRYTFGSINVWDFSDEENDEDE